MSYYDRFFDTPWINTSLIATLNCHQGEEVRELGRNNATCVRCEGSNYSSHESLLPCQHCSGDVDVGHTNCTFCPQGAFFKETRCVCNSGYYRANTTLTQCLPCPSFRAKCDGSSLKAADNFWQVNESDIFLPCTNQEACRDGTCTLGYTGYLCGECQQRSNTSDTMYGQLHRLCEECPSSPLVNSLTLLASLLVSLSMFVLLVYMSLNHQPGEARMSVTALKIGLSAAQVNAMLPALGVRLTSTLTGLIGLQTSASGPALLSLSCAYLNAG